MLLDFWAVARGSRQGRRLGRRSYLGTIWGYRGLFWYILGTFWYIFVISARWSRPGRPPGRRCPGGPFNWLRLTQPWQHWKSRWNWQYQSGDNDDFCIDDKKVKIPFLCFCSELTEENTCFFRFSNVTAWSWWKPWRRRPTWQRRNFNRWCHQPEHQSLPVSGLTSMKNTEGDCCLHYPIIADHVDKASATLGYSMYFHRTSWPAALLRWQIVEQALKSNFWTFEEAHKSSPSFSAGSCLALLDAVLLGEVKQRPLSCSCVGQEIMVECSRWRIVSCHRLWLVISTESLGTRFIGQERC